MREKHSSNSAASSDFTMDDVQDNVAEGRRNGQQTDQGFGQNADNVSLVQVRGYRARARAPPQGFEHQIQGSGLAHLHQIASGVTITAPTGYQGLRPGNTVDTITTGLPLKHFNEALIEPAPYKLPKLRDDNFHEWTCSMKRFLRSRLLWGIVDGSLPCPTHPVQARNWMRYSDHVHALLLCSATSTQLSYISLNDDTTPKEIFETWSHIHQPKSTGRLFFLLRKMLTVKPTAKDNVDKIASAIRRSNEQVGMIDKSAMLNDICLGVMIMKAFREVPRFNLALRRLEKNDEDDFSSEKVIQSLRNTEQRTAKSSPIARVSQKTTKPRRKVECYNCQKMGHIARHCAEE